MDLLIKIKQKLDAMKNTAIALKNYQENKITYNEFVLDYLNLNRVNIETNHLPHTIAWLLEQNQNILPNTSSGSLMVAIIDFENIYTNLIDEEVEQLEDDNIIDEVRHYHNQLFRNFL